VQVAKERLSLKDFSFLSPIKRRISATKNTNTATETEKMVRTIDYTSGGDKWHEQSRRDEENKTNIIDGDMNYRTQSTSLQSGGDLLPLLEDKQMK